MLSYDQCLALKKIGFPQPDLECSQGEFAYAYRDDNQELQMFHRDNDECRTVGNDYSNALSSILEEGITLTFCPILEDLIAELVDTMWWLMRSHNKKYFVCGQGVFLADTFFDSPEEALCALLLAIYASRIPSPRKPRPPKEDGE